MEYRFCKKFITYFYELCPDLFFVAAKQKNKIIAGIWGPVKPWWDGNKVYDPEIFVDKEHQSYFLNTILKLRQKNIM